MRFDVDSTTIVDAGANVTVSEKFLCFCSRFIMGHACCVRQLLNSMQPDRACF